MEERPIAEVGQRHLPFLEDQVDLCQAEPCLVGQHLEDRAQGLPAFLVDRADLLVDLCLEAFGAEAPWLQVDRLVGLWEACLAVVLLWVARPWVDREVDLLEVRLLAAFQVVDLLEEVLWADRREHL